MSTELVSFDYQGRAVAFDPAVKMWNLNAMHQAAGSEPNKAPRFWLRQVQTQELIAALAAEETVSEDHSFVETREGRSGGTWAHWQIAAAYAHYLDARFYLQWNRWAMERVTDQSSAGELTELRGLVQALATDVALLRAQITRRRSKHAPASPQLPAPRAVIDDAQILVHLTITRDPRDLLTTAEIAAHLAARGVELGGPLVAQQMIIAGLLHRHDVARAPGRAAQTQRYGKPCRAWAGVRFAEA